MITTIHPQQIQDISNMTANNRHGEALEYIAKITKQEKAQKIFALINQLHDIEGHLPSELISYRRQIRDKMLTQIEKEKGTKYYMEIRSAL